MNQAIRLQRAEELPLEGGQDFGFRKRNLSQTTWVCVRVSDTCVVHGCVHSRV